MYNNVFIIISVIFLVTFFIIMFLLEFKQKKNRAEQKAPKQQSRPDNLAAPEKEFKESADTVLKKALTELLNSLYREVMQLGKDESVEGIPKKIDALIQTLYSPLLVTVLGEFSSGKSTFINCLLDEKILAMKVRPTTATITKLQYGEKKRLEVNFRDGFKKEFSIEDLHTLTVENFVNEKNILDDIAYVQLELKNDFLRSIDLADTPGFNSNLERHSQLTADFINHSDIIFWLFDANQLEKKSTFELIQKHCKYHKPIGILNKIDQITEENPEPEARKYIKELIETISPFTERTFAVSSRQALNPDTINNSGINEIKNYFTSEIIPDSYKRKKLILASKITHMAIEIYGVREKLMDVTERQKNELQNFRKCVEKYEQDFNSYQSSLKNWNNDVEKYDLGHILKNINKYFLVDGPDKNLVSRSNDYHYKYTQLISDNKKIDNWFKQISDDRGKLENEYNVWLNAYKEYDGKLGKQIIDGIWSFFSGNDFTDEKLKLNNLQYNYTINESKFNEDVDQYNSFLETTQTSWKRLETSALDFLNNVVKEKMELQYEGIQRQLNEIEKKESSMRKLEAEYHNNLNKLRIFDDSIYKILFNLYVVLHSNELTKQHSEISDFESLISNYKQYNDGYVNLDWKELYSRSKINKVINTYNTADYSNNAVRKQQNNQTRTTIRV